MAKRCYQIGSLGVYEVTGKVCRRCTARVYKTDNPKQGYSYQCFECDEDLFPFEVMPESHLAPKIEGTKEEAGFISTEHVDQPCFHCGNTTFNVPISRMSLCAHCFAEIFPCIGCPEEKCGWNRADKGCQRFIHTPAWKEAQGKDEWQ